ncbi:hypothetical protein D3C87_881510 [compost metagenome]
MPHGRIGRDPRAEQGSRLVERDGLRHPHDEVLVHRDPARIPPVGRGLPVPLQAIVGPGRAALAELLFACLAGLALPAGIHQAAHADRIADLPLRHRRPDAGNRPHDLVAGHHGVARAAPLVLHLMQVRVADPAVPDVDQHVVGAGLPPLDDGRSQGSLRFGGRIGGSRNHVYISSRVMGPSTLPTNGSGSQSPLIFRKLKARIKQVLNLGVG